MKQIDDATAKQIQAARPDRSTWLSANAGSGKTRVLTDRVARLLLRGVEPQHILCLTYTKAAATEMQNRLFKRLGAWSMLEDADLCTALSELGVQGPFEAPILRMARTLFARAIETPGGLKIQTIHSFCASLLRRFPLEAGVSTNFTEIEERDAAILRNEIVATMAEGTHSDLLRRVAFYHSAETFETLTQEIVRHQTALMPRRPATEVYDLFDLPMGFTDRDLLAEALDGGEGDLIATLVPLLRLGGANDNKAAEALAPLVGAHLGSAALATLEQVLLTGAGAKEPFTAKTGSFPTKALVKAQSGALDPILPALDALMARIEATRPRRLALDAVRRTLALHDFAEQFLPAYARSKQARGWLDFDDLITKARQLLTNPAVAAWVLYRLDGGIDHILVDEAQDTSPEQWRVIALLAQEFFSGAGARPETQRTVFVVGDTKQSIYSFQGADPREFERMKQDFAARMAPVSQTLQSFELEHSFRSASAILDLVDNTFRGRESSGFPTAQKHRAFKTDLPGRVDLWPPIAPVDKPEPGDWSDPVDQLSQDHHMTRLAQRIADNIKATIDSGAILPQDGQAARPVRPGDFLILVQRRSELFHEIIRACKSLGLPVAGADRLKVAAELAVRDLAALLSFLSTPEDDLALATVLKSPLLGWDEQALFDLAHRRTTKHLWQALRARAEEFPETMQFLNDLRGKTDFLRPYDLIDRILTRHDGRRKLIARLGAEAEDGIDALLSQALSYERTSVPNLTGFLVWFETDSLEIKRQMGSAGNLIRIMTVHGAKGLESPIVILPDTAHRPIRSRDRLLPIGDLALWAGPTADSPDVVSAARAVAADNEKAERDRLLYVAMTRAEKWLIVAAAGDLGNSGDSWYHQVEAGLAQCNAEKCEFAFGSGLRLENGDWTALDVVSDSPAPSTNAELPGYFHLSPSSPAILQETLRPSDLGGAKAMPGEEGRDETTALRRGSQIHQLLEHLPAIDPSNRPALAARLLAQADLAANTAELRLLLEEVNGVLDAPDLSEIFAPDGLSEVPVSANIAELGNRRIHGTIDRLILRPERVLAVDFKSNGIIPDRAADCPDGLLRQMGAYYRALEAIYPGRTIEVALLWTRTATLMYLPQDIVIPALEATQIS